MSYNVPQFTAKQEHRINEVLSTNPLSYDTPGAIGSYECTVTGCTCGDSHVASGDRKNHAELAAKRKVKLCIGRSLGYTPRSEIMPESKKDDTDEAAFAAEAVAVATA